MPAYTPRPGDLVRDASDCVWFIYADCMDPKQLYAIGAEFTATSGGHPLTHVRREWGPLRLEHRPA
ncbi:hypothetical protein ABZ635_22005 [Nocardiopsis sp. NPDC007018]|uniref:hypothetical protein n=1 Tax=Nocardiopsis sp. NPDC007018 TaxID=3155721 RepID=UPI0033D7BC98